jgi:hypothetical protein
MYIQLNPPDVNSYFVAIKSNMFIFMRLYRHILLNQIAALVLSNFLVFLYKWADLFTMSIPLCF